MPKKRNPLCNVPGCGQPRYKEHGKCHAHMQEYWRQHVTGKPAAPASANTPPVAVSVKRDVHAAYPSLRRCSTCGCARPAIDEHFDLAKDGPFGILNWVCRHCDGTYQAPVDAAALVADLRGQIETINEQRRQYAEESRQQEREIADLRGAYAALNRQYEDACQQLQARPSIVPVSDGNTLNVVVTDYKANALFFLTGQIVAEQGLPDTDGELRKLLSAKRREGFYIAD